MDRNRIIKALVEEAIARLADIRELCPRHAFPLYEQEAGEDLVLNDISLRNRFHAREDNTRPLYEGSRQSHRIHIPPSSKYACSGL